MRLMSLPSASLVLTSLLSIQAYAHTLPTSATSLTSTGVGLSSKQEAQKNTNKIMYITDKLKVTLRSGPGLKYQIIKMLSTGNKVTAISTSSNGYTQVQLPNGGKGWILSRYLISSPPSALVLPHVKSQLASTKNSLNQALKKISQEQAKLTDLQKSKKQLQGKYNALNQNYHSLVKTSKNAVDLKKQNTFLAKKADKNIQTLNDLSRENKKLHRQLEIKWFIAGGGVLFVGLLIGLLLPKLIRRRRDNWFN